MADFFFDNSGIVKRCVAEVGTNWVNGIVDPAMGHRLSTSRITGVEVVAAQTRRARVGGFSPASLATTLATWELDFINQFSIVEISPSSIARAMMLARTYGLRGYDAVQLASVLWFQANDLTSGRSLTLVSADRELNAAALAEGLDVEDPNNHP